MTHSNVLEDEDTSRLFTAQLVLRPMEDRDAKSMAALLSEWEVVKQASTVPHPYDERSALTWIARVRRRHLAGRQFAFAITRPGSDELIGSVALTVLPEPGGHIGEVGYWLGRPFWGQGYGSEAVEALTDFGLNALSLSRIEAVVFKDNKSSCRVLDRCGYRLERTEVRQYPDRGGRRKILLYSISQTSR